jgi:transposase
MTTSRKPYPSDVSDEEWALAAPYLTLLPEDAGQRTHRLREVFDGLRYLVRYGVPWRALPNDLPPWHAVYDQAQRWLRAGCFEMLAHDLRAVLRLAAGRSRPPRSWTAARCAARPRAARGPAGTVTSAHAARSCTSPWTRSATCSR